ncbi:MAG: hybrid sensor histidine kinase/response regulator [Microcoleaceae cyanobacterium]
MIEDEELREAFKVASEEHLQNLDQGLLHLEQHPEDIYTFNDLLREAHSLKGDAGMLGVKDVATLSHEIEYLLGSLQRGEIPPSAEVSDRLFQGLDGLRKLVHEAVTGEPAGVNTFYLLAHLLGARAASTADLEVAHFPEPQAPSLEELTQYEQNAEGPNLAPENPEPAATVTTEIQSPEIQAITESPTISVIQAVPVSTIAIAPNPTEPPSANVTKAPVPNATSPDSQTTPSTTYTIDTIRVPTRNLDALMTQTGELTVTKIRIAHRLSEVEEILARLEEWNRDAFVNRSAFQDVGVQNGLTILSGGRSTQLQHYHQRATARLDQLSSLTNQLRGALYEDITRLNLISTELEETVQTLRLLPLSAIFNLYPRMVRDLARQQQKLIDLGIEGGETLADKRVLEEMKDPLMHILRNAVDHGIESPEERERQGKPRTAQICLKGQKTPASVVIEIQDDGRGLGLENIKQTALRRGLYSAEELDAMSPNQIQSLIFVPGFSTRTTVTEVSGRGIGMDVVRENIERLKGTITVSSNPGKGCTFRIQLRTTLATTHVLIVAVQGISYGIPVDFVQTTCLIKAEEVFTIEGHSTILLAEQPTSVAELADLLELQPQAIQHREIQHSGTESSSESRPCIILKVGEEQVGLFVDELIDAQDVVLKPQSQLLKRVRNVSGATILGTGEVCMILNPQDLIQSVRKGFSPRTFAPNVNPKATTEWVAKQKKPIILLVEDSIATRIQEKRILEAAGYEVITAVDGVDGFNKLCTQNFDAVISDIQMPNMDGLTFAEKIRQQFGSSELPIILVTSLASDADKLRGAEAGANAYITKGNFNQDVLIATLQRLV